MPILRVSKVFCANWIMNQQILVGVHSALDYNWKVSQYCISSNNHPTIIHWSSNHHPRCQFVKFYWNWEASAIFIIVLFVWLQMWTLFVAKFIPDPEWRNSPKCSFLWLRINERFPKLPFYFKINFLGIDTYLFFLIIISIFLESPPTCFSSS